MLFRYLTQSEKDIIGELFVYGSTRVDPQKYNQKDKDSLIKMGLMNLDGSRLTAKCMDLLLSSKENRDSVGVKTFTYETDQSIF